MTFLFPKNHLARLLISLFFFAFLKNNYAYSQDTEIPEFIRACQYVAEQSSRLACYDRVLPPIAETVDSDDSLASRAELAASVAELELELQQQNETMVQIVEVQRPNLRLSRIVTTDGRVFVSNTTTIPRWPETPFEAEIQTGRLGATYLVISESRQRIRVVLED